MAEITYLPEVECLISSEHGLLNTEVLSVRDLAGKRQHLRVGKGFVTRTEGKTYLPVGIVQLDYRNKKALIELPFEADSGANRLWVPFTAFRPEGDQP